MCVGCNVACTVKVRRGHRHGQWRLTQDAVARHEMEMVVMLVDCV